MSRPQKLTMDFFIHDADASSDRKIRLLSKKYGNDGYAAYFRLLESVCHEEGMQLNLSDKETSELISEDFHLRDVTHLHQIVQYCADIGLFDKQLWESERVVFSNGLYRRYQGRLEERKAAAARKRRSREVKALQGKIKQLEHGVVTRDKEVVTETSQNGHRPEYRIQNTDLRTTDLRTTDPQNAHDRAHECDSRPELSQPQNLGSDPLTEKSAPLSTKSEHAGHFTTLGSRSESSAPRQVDPTHPVATVEAYYRGGWRDEFPWVESRRGFNYAYKPAMVAAVIAHLKAVPSYDGNAEELSARAVRWLNRANQDGLRASDAWAIWGRVKPEIEADSPVSSVAEINRLAGMLQRHESWFDFLESWSAQAVGRVVSLPSQLTADEQARLLGALRRRVEEVAA